MLTRFVCLANSYKEGGRCLAGIELNSKNKPLTTAGHPKWVRPICKTPHGEVPTHLVSHIQILDIIEIEETGFPTEKNYQSENVFFNKKSLNIIGKFDISNIDQLCDNRDLIFGNRGKAVSEEAIANLSYSLMFIHINQFEVIEKRYEDSNKTQERLVFSYNNTRYDLPITDPVFLHLYKTDPDVLDNINKLYICLSLGVNFEDWYYKLVAGIFLIKNSSNIIITEEIDDWI